MDFPPQENPSRKRKIEEIIQTTEKTNPWPRFLMLTSTNENQPISKLSPFAIAKGLKGLAGEPKNMTKLRSGDFLLEVSSKSHSDNLLRSTLLAGIPIRIAPHRRLNSSKGVIRCRELNQCAEEEILEELKDQGVTDVKCCTRKTTEGTVKTGTYFLEFNTPDLPASIKVAWMNIKITKYIPNPMRCFHCQKFGHSSNNCKNPQLCAKCGTEGHLFDNCPGQPFCVNCKGSHPSSSKNCPMFIKEKEIQAYKIDHNVSFPEARKAIESRTPTAGHTYAAVVRTTKDAQTQTSIETQVSAEEIDAEIKQALSSQKSVSAGLKPPVKTKPSVPPRPTHTNQPTPQKPSSNNMKIIQKSPSPQMSGRSQKGRDPVSIYNRYRDLDGLEEMDMDNDPCPESSPKTQKPQVPHKPPSPTKPSAQGGVVKLNR